MSLLSASGGGTSASGNDAASPGVTASDGASLPAPLLGAVGLLSLRGADAGAAFEEVLASEAAPAWRAVALLGRGLCEEMAGSRDAARASVSSALEQWARAEPASCAVALAALGRALSGGGHGGASAAFMESARRMAGGSSREVLGAVLVELGSAVAESGEAHTAAVHWREALELGDPQTRAAAAANLGRLAAARGDWAAADRMFDLALAVPDGAHVPVVADGLVALAAQAGSEGLWEEADARLRQALPLRQSDGDRPGVAEVLHDLGIASWRQGDLHWATRCLEDCRTAAEDLGDHALRGAALRALAMVALEGGRPVVALAYAQEAALAARGAEERRACAVVLQQVGEEARRQGSASLSSEAFRAAAQNLEADD